MAKQKKSSNTVLKLVFGAVTLFALGTAFVGLSEYFFGQQTSYLSKAATSQATLLPPVEMRDKDGGSHGIVTGIRATSSTEWPPKEKAETPTIQEPKGTYSNPSKAQQIRVAYESDVVKTITIQTSATKDFANPTTQHFDRSYWFPNWKQLRLSGGIWTLDYSFPPNKSLYVRTRVDEFTDTFNGQVYTQLASDWSKPVLERFQPTYTVRAPSLVAPANGATVTSPATFSWKKASDNANGVSQLLCISTSKTPYGGCEILALNVSGVTSMQVPSNIFTNGQTYRWQVCDASPKWEEDTSECSAVGKFVFSSKTPTPTCRTSIQCFKAPCPCLP